MLDLVRYTKNLLKKIKRLADKKLGSLPEEIYWKVKGNSWARESLSLASLQHPVRKYIAHNIEQHTPFTNLLEIGCSSGANLYTLANLYRDSEFTGIDINRQAIEVGNKFLMSKGCCNATLQHKHAGDCSSFSANQFDITLTSACLIHIGPDKVQSIINEMVRITSKTILLIELGSNEDQLYTYDYRWYYNWSKLFAPYDKKALNIEKLPAEIYGAPWPKYGFLITVHLNKPT